MTISIFTNTSNEYIGGMTMKIFIQKKIDMLENIIYELKKSEDFISLMMINILCIESSRKDSIIDIKNSLDIHYSLKSKHPNYVINVLKQEHFLLRMIQTRSVNARYAR